MRSSVLFPSIFMSAIGRSDANVRNYIRGLGKHNPVSQIWPYMSRRPIAQTEVLFGGVYAQVPQKFINKVNWRGYCKVWLERGAQVRRNYVQGLNGDIAAVARYRHLRRDLLRAADGQTGIANYECWAQELVDAGYLQDFDRQSVDKSATATLAASHLRLSVADHVAGSKAGSLADTALRVGFNVDAKTAGDYDASIWPFATAGAFILCQKIPDIFARKLPDWVQE